MIKLPLKLIRTFVICISLLGSNLSWAQDSVRKPYLPEVFSFSDTEMLIYGGEYNEAIYQLNKRFFVYPDSSSGKLNLLLGLCYANLSDYKKAELFFDQAYFSSETKELKHEAIFNKVQVLINQEKYMLALGELFELNITEENVNWTRYNLYFGVINFLIEDYEIAETAFKACVTDTNLIHEKFASIEELNKPQSGLAIIYSALLPGLGQIYVGAYREALNSVLINALFAGVYIYVLYTVGPIDAVLTTLPWFQRYYAGGYNKAGVLANMKQDTKKTQFLKEIILTISQSTAQADSWPSE